MIQIHHIINVLTEILRQTLLYDIIGMGLYIWDIKKPLLVHIIKINIYNKGKE